MATRPSAMWREAVEEEPRLVASGELDEDFAVMAELYPEELIRRTDEALEAFEQELDRLRQPSDEEVMDVVRRAVLALNAVHHDFHEDAYATMAREQLCEYIDAVVTESGVDVHALTRRLGIPSHALTDEWRAW